MRYLIKVFSDFFLLYKNNLNVGFKLINCQTVDHIVQYTHLFILQAAEKLMKVLPGFLFVCLSPSGNLHWLRSSI